MKYDFTNHEYIYTRVNGSEYRCTDYFPAIVQTFWSNDPVDWDLEKKVTWDELAPSLQELIIRKIKFSDFDPIFQNRIIKIENDIVTVNNNLNIEIDNRQKGDQLLQEQVDDLKRRMTSAESRLTVLERRMDEAERQIELIWIEIRKLWKEIGDIWGSDGKVLTHNITYIWKEFSDIWGTDGKNIAHNITNIWKKLGSLESSINGHESRIKTLEECCEEMKNREPQPQSPDPIDDGGGGGGEGGGDEDPQPELKLRFYNFKFKNWGIISSPPGIAVYATITFSWEIDEQIAKIETGGTLIFQRNNVQIPYNDSGQAEILMYKGNKTGWQNSLKSPSTSTVTLTGWPATGSNAKTVSYNVSIPAYNPNAPVYPDNFNNTGEPAPSGEQPTAKSIKVGDSWGFLN